MLRSRVTTGRIWGKNPCPSIVHFPLRVGETDNKINLRIHKRVKTTREKKQVRGMGLLRLKSGD